MKQTPYQAHIKFVRELRAPVVRYAAAQKERQQKRERERKKVEDELSNKLNEKFNELFSNLDDLDDN